MGEAAAQTAATLAQLQSSLDILHGVVAGVDTAQQQMRAQLDHQAEAIAASSSKHDDTARILQGLLAKLQLLEQGPTNKPPPAEVEPGPGFGSVIITAGHSTIEPSSPHWFGNTAGASSSATHGHGPSREAEPGGGAGGGGGLGGAGGGGPGGVGGGGAPGGAGGSGFGGAGVGRTGSTHHDQGGRPQMPKMPFPRFDGEQPRIWRDKCYDYFRAFNISATLWLTTATLHMDGNAAIWLQAYKQRHTLSTWPQFIMAVEAEFGGDDQRRSLKALLALKQTGSVEEYQREFQTLVYQVSMYNPNYDENFFIAQFIKGLKAELRGMVEAQVPETLERAYLLARVQQEVLEDNRLRAPKFAPRAESYKTDAAKPGFKPATGDLWKERQLRDYRRANGQCFKCGQKYDPTHICGQKQVAVANMMENVEDPIQLSEEVLNLMEMHDLAGAQLLSLSINAIAGSEDSHCLRLRALVGNQVMLILVDSGSSNSFINASMVDRINCETIDVAPMPVKVANGQYMYTTKMVPALSWWSHGATFTTPMRVLELGGYDAILGVDWLKLHSPMTTDWNKKFISFPYQGQQVTLHGVQATQTSDVREVPVEQLAKWVKGNEVWAVALLHPTTNSSQVETAVYPPEVQSLLTQFSSVFSEPTTLPPVRQYDHSIPLKAEAAPFNARPYRYSPAHKDEIEKQVAQMIAAGIITPSMSPFASPVLLVQKKDGSWRFCVDYRRLNELTIRNVFPMPVIDELLDELAGAKIFSKLDLRAGYHQIRMLPSDEHKTAFKTHQGHYQFRVMPFGLCNAPATFQCVMNSVLQPCLRRSVLVFMDDILVYSPSLETHMEHLREVLCLLRDAQLFVKLNKCSFACASLEYLGHIISGEGVATDPRKTQAMVDWPLPTTVTELRGFLGLTGYYRKFVRNYGIIAKPLTMLLKKKGFVWDAKATEAFEALKLAMTSTPVLQLPDFQKQFTVETDACHTGIGAVLMQDHHPLAFLSKPLSAQHQEMSIYEKEFLALIMAVERWRPYLQRGEFIVKTDHHSLSFLERQELQSPLQKKAMARLMGLQFKIVYRQGAENHAADALSRIGHLMAIQACTEVQPAWMQEVVNSYVTDPVAQERLVQLALASPDEHGYELTQGIIRFQGRIWLGANAALQTKIIAALHSSAVGGHSGVQATYHRVKRLFAWHGLKSDVQDFVRQCDTCQHAKHTNTRPGGLLQPLPVPDGAWRDITMDFIDGLPLSEGFDVILVVVDRFTKYAHFVPLRHPYSAPKVARVFVDSVVKLHGMPHSITSDRDPIFTSNFWKLLFKSLGTKLQFTTAYHPQTDGQSERVNQCLEMFLRCMVQENPKQWRTWLPLAEFWYNSTFHTALGCSPFKAMYGHEPNLGALPAVEADSPVAGVLQDRALQIETIKQHLTTAQNRMKIYADSKRSERVFQVGDKVLLKLQPYAQKTVVNRPYPKLAYKYFGPFTVLERIGQVAYRLELPPSSQVHNVFHVSQIKDYRSDYSPVFAELPKTPALDTEDTAPEKILDRRLVKRGHNALPQVLIKWTNLPEDAATWENWETLKVKFPAVLAWGQASSSGGGPVTTNMP